MLGAGAPAAAAAVPGAGGPAAALPEQPTAFEANAGQFDRRVRFAARGPGHALLLTDRGASLAFRGRSLTGGRSSSLATIELVGASRRARIAGVGRTGGTANYFSGRDRRHWRAGVPTYEGVRHTEAWPGIDVVFRGLAEGVRYDFLLRPGSDPRRIRLALDGAGAAEVNDRGELVLPVAGGVLHQPAPRTWQVIGGVRRPVASRWKIDEDGRAGFRLGPYDRSRPLVIDPTLVYSSYLGGTGDEFSQGIARDAAGNLYVAGITSSTDFPVTPGAFQTTSLGGTFNGYDVFVAKIGPAGQRVYATYLGGAGDDEGYDVAVDGAGQAHVTGISFSGNFPTTPGSLKPTYVPPPNTGNGFVTKLSATGSSLVYSTYLGGAAANAQGITVDGAGNAWVTGSAGTADFPVTAGAAQPAFAGTAGGFNSNAFVARLNPAGSALGYGTYLSGGQTGVDTNPNTVGLDIAVDGAGNAYVTGETDTTNFPTTAGALQGTRTRAENGFVTRFTSAGAFAYSTYLPQDDGRAIAVDGAGNAYVAGADQGQAYMAKVTPTGGGLRYATRLGPGSANGVGVDAAGNAVTVGQAAAGFGTTAGAHQPSFAGGSADAFLTRLAPTGGPLYSTYLGGTGFDMARSVALDPLGNAVLTGDTDSADFPTVRPGQAQRSGGSDALVAAFQLVDPAAPAPRPPATALPPPVLGRAVNVVPLRGRVYVSTPPRRARASATVPGIKGRNFVLLREARQIPVGSLLDTRRGSLRLVSARDSGGRVQSGEFSAGVFQVLQSRRTRARGLTELRLKGFSFRRCGRARRSTAGTARVSRRRIRRLRGNARGRFRTRGRYSAATVRGTIWTTTDRCDGTLTSVRRGRVTVRDFRRRKTITLRAGKRYLARARR